MGVLCLVFVILLADNAVAVKKNACPLKPLTSICKTDEILKLNGLYAVAKKTATNCTHEYSNTHPECCEENSEDCKMKYNGTRTSYYFKSCVAKWWCQPKATWQRKTDSCSGSEYLDKTTYMVMDYRCIAKRDIIEITSNRTRTNSTLTLSGPDYPASSLPAYTGGVCTVSASSGTINITAIDLSFQNDNGICKQYIDIAENGANKRQINCSDNNEDRKEPKTLYTSQTHFLTLKYNSCLHTNTGRMWIEFEGTDENATIELRCGTSMQTSVPEVKDCPQSTLHGSKQWTSFGPEQGSSLGPKQETKGSSLKSQNKDADHSMSTGELAGIVSGSLLALILLILCLLVWRHKKKMARNRNRVSDSGDTQSEDGFAAAPGITGRSAIPGSAPASSALGAPPTRLTPVAGTTTGPGASGRVAWGPTPS